MICDPRRARGVTYHRAAAISSVRSEYSCTALVPIDMDVQPVVTVEHVVASKLSETVSICDHVDVEEAVADLGGGQGGQGPPKILSAILLFTSHASHSHIWLATRQA